jgi:hypothetical protein
VTAGIANGVALDDCQKQQITFLLERGAATIPHSGISLLVHFLNTRNLLNRWGASPAVCAAGLYHSIYGTEGFGTGMAAWDERPVIRRLVGKEAERLVFLFCRSSRAHFMASLDGPVPGIRCRLTGRCYRTSTDEITGLVSISAANAIDQFSRVDPDRRCAMGAFLTRSAPFLSPAARKDAAAVASYGPRRTRRRPRQ